MHRALLFARDLSECRRAQQALCASEERFRTLVQFSFDVYWESDAQHRFTRSARRRSTDCVVADVRMPGMTGLELYQALVTSGNRIPTVLITAYPEDPVRVRARDAGITCFLSKPFAPEELLECIQKALAHPGGSLRPPS